MVYITVLDYHLNSWFIRIIFYEDISCHVVDTALHSFRLALWATLPCTSVRPVLIPHHYAIHSQDRTPWFRHAASKTGIFPSPSRDFLSPASPNAAALRPLYSPSPPSIHLSCVMFRPSHALAANHSTRTTLKESAITSWFRGRTVSCEYLLPLR